MAIGKYNHKNHSQETKEKIRKSHLGRKHNWNNSKTLKERYRKGEIINAMKDKKRPDNLLRNKKRNQKGKNNGNWKGDKAITPTIMRLRMSWKYRQWRSDIFERDNYICQKCGQVGKKLNADHIKPFSHIIKDNNIITFEEGMDCEELWNINNGRTLCFKCHTQTKTFANKARRRI